jgi:SAM-dependent methyltransferase
VTGWFEPLYAAAAAGEAEIPWDRDEPGGVLVEWSRGLDGRGRRAVVVGSAGGADAEYVAGLGFETVGFDIAPAAVELARSRHPGSRVDYVTADLLDLPSEWLGAFDLVVESINVQALPDTLRTRAIANVARLVAPGGTLFVTEAVRADGDPPAEGPPWPLTRAEIESFGGGGLEPVRIDVTEDRWRAEFSRPACGGARSCR